MLVIAGGDLVLPDRIQSRGALMLETAAIASIEQGRPDPSGAEVIEAGDC